MSDTFEFTVPAGKQVFCTSKSLKRTNYNFRWPQKEFIPNTTLHHDADGNVSLQIPSYPDEKTWVLYGSHRPGVSWAGMNTISATPSDNGDNWHFEFWINGPTGPADLEVFAEIK
ncbi:MAG: hypothetical protein GY761_16395 [Hyphomicrobiales bacterium]|nr:hypothetical protein [Hyphomicrobiales bacterium]